MTHPAPDPASGTATPSLRRRVTLTVLGLFALLLVVVGVAVDVALGAQLRRELDTRLVDRAARAVSFTAAGATPQELPDLLGGRDIRIRVTTSDGSSYGDRGLAPRIAATGPTRSASPKPAARPAPPIGGPAARGPAGGPGPGPPPPPPPDPPERSSMTLTQALPDGSQVLLVADTTQIIDVRDNLRLIMAVAGVVILGLAALLLLGAIGRALSPLDRLTGLAQRITSGDRGRRLRPDRAGTELGRAAAAFDGMLDALEATEHRAQQAAEQARRAEAQTRRFLSDAAHELRTPLAGIQAVAEQLAQHPDGADGLRLARRTDLLMRETTRIARLVTDMLDMARIDSGLTLQQATVDLGGLLDTEADRARMLSPTLHIHRTGLASVPIRADPVRVSQILSNLANNARRHTPPGGIITLHLDTTPSAGEHIVAEQARVTITDTGPGIPDTERERIFERLVRLSQARDRDSGGAGLGLAIARGLAHAHNGTLTCLPSAHGAVFQLTMPAASPSFPGVIDG